MQLVLVAYPDRRGTLPVEQLLDVKFRGVEVEEGVHFYERNTSKLYVRELKPSQLIFAEGFAARPGTRRLKRILDVGRLVLGLVLAAPLMLLDDARHQARVARPGALQAGARRRVRPPLHDPQVPLDAHRRGESRRAVRARRTTRA